MTAEQAQWTVDEDGTLHYGDRRMAHNLVRCSLTAEHPESGPNYLPAEAHAALCNLVNGSVAPDLPDAVQAVIDAAEIVADNLHGDHHDNWLVLRDAVRALRATTDRDDR